MRRVFYYLISGLIPVAGWAQPQDTAFIKASADAALVSYTNATRFRDLVFSGIEYYPFDGATNSFPYYQSEYAEEGEVMYDNQVFVGVPILYDLVTDQLVAEHYDQSGLSAMIALSKHRVSYFRLMGKKFVHLPDSKDGHIQDGYYALLLDGDVTLYARYRKKKREQVAFGQSHIVTEFDEKSSYILVKNDQAYPIGSKGTLLKILEDEKKALRSHITSNRLDFVNNREQSFVALVNYYNKLKAGK